MGSDGGSGNKPMQIMHVETSFRTNSINGTKTISVSVDSLAGKKTGRHNGAVISPAYIPLKGLQ
jgi:hypothetical protein